MSVLIRVKLFVRSCIHPIRMRRISATNYVEISIDDPERCFLGEKKKIERHNVPRYDITHTHTHIHIRARHQYFLYPALFNARTGPYVRKEILDPFLPAKQQDNSMKQKPPVRCMELLSK